MFFVTFQSGSKEKPDGVRRPLDEPVINAPCGRQSAGWGWGCDSPRTAQESRCLPSRMSCSFLSRVSLVVGWDVRILPPGMPLRALWQSLHCYGLGAVAPYNLPDEALPVWAWDNCSSQEPCQTRDPMELPRLSCDGKQLAECPRGDRVHAPLPPCHLIPVLTSIPLAPFPTMVATGWELWSPRPQSQALLLAPFRPQTSRAVERTENEQDEDPTRAGRGRTSGYPRGYPEQVVQGPDHQRAGLASLPPCLPLCQAASFWMTLDQLLLSSSPNPSPASLGLQASCPNGQRSIFDSPDAQFSKR